MVLGEDRESYGHYYKIILSYQDHSFRQQDTLSRWISEVIRPFAIDSSRTRAHGKRGIEAPTALVASVPVEDILKAAVWRMLTIFVACYLSNNLQAESPFGSTVMCGPAGTRSHPLGLPPSGSPTQC